ncbi:MAG: hypothetical protein AAB227_00720, partial [Pseudomonadota bacterium]
MTLENIYYIGQTVAVVAVVASLVFVGLQVRQSARVAKAEMHANIMNHMPQLVLSWHLSEKSHDIDPAGDIDLEKLTAAERGALMSLYWSWLKAAETWHYQWTHGFLSKDDWFGLTSPVAALPDQHPFREYWRRRQATSPPAFRQAMNNVLESHPSKEEMRAVMKEARGLAPGADATAAPAGSQPGEAPQ